MFSTHWFVFECPAGEFHFGEKLPTHSVTHGRFTSREEACQHAEQLRRDFLTPACDKFGNPLTMRERAYLGVWHPTLYEEAMARGRARDRRAMAVTA
jgi:hypothetical protein